MRACSRTGNYVRFAGEADNTKRDPASRMSPNDPKQTLASLASSLIPLAKQTQYEEAGSGAVIGAELTLTLPPNFRKARRLALRRTSTSPHVPRHLRLPPAKQIAFLGGGGARRPKSCTIRACQ